MEIIVLNGNPTEDNPAFDTYINELAYTLEATNQPTEILPLRELDAGYCTGCWSCWVKTPGLCMFRDDSHLVCRKVINSDLVIFASPIIMGYFSALLKKFTDKLIPLVHPYFAVAKGEVHHRHRYPRKDYPLGGLLLEKTPGADQEDIDIIQEIQSRTMLNFKSRNAFTKLTEDPIEEVVNAIISL